MEENNNNHNFKAVSNQNEYSYYNNSEKKQSKVGFGKSVVLPFFSGVLGCSIVIGTCFGIPSIRNNLVRIAQHII